MTFDKLKARLATRPFRGRKGDDHKPQDESELGQREAVESAGWGPELRISLHEMEIYSTGDTHQVTVNHIGTYLALANKQYSSVRIARCSLLDLVIVYLC